MLNFLRKIVPERSPIRLMYHKISAIIANLVFGFPSNKMRVIAVTGTSGKSTTVEMIHAFLQRSGKNAGSISTVSIHIGDKEIPNESLRTSLRPWAMQKYIRQMARAGCEVCVIEVSSHAIDQNRIWGLSVDTAVLTNLYDNEHLDYHGDFMDYVKTKLKLFQGVNNSYRKTGVDKSLILNKDDEHFSVMEDISADYVWSYSLKKSANFKAENIDCGYKGCSFDLKLPNYMLNVQSELVGEHNLKNLLCAMSTVLSTGVHPQVLEKNVQEFGGISGRMESVDEGQDFKVIVDFSYKPSALMAVMETLRKMVPGRIIVVWGGAGGRSKENWQESAKIISEQADEFVFTTDDPYDTDIKYISKCVRAVVDRPEGDRFFEIEDRYEAIRFGLYTADEGDCVLIAGRGHEQTQTIKGIKIPFDDRTVAREILQFR